jgi:large subunit ribosomal protein L22
METKATAKWVRTSAPKLRRLTRMIVGKPVPEAQAILRLAPSPAAADVRKVLASAAANAEDRFSADAKELYVTRAYVDEGLTLKRFTARSRGMANRIRRRTSHVTVVVGDLSSEE